MPKLEESTIVENGKVMGYVLTEKVGSKCFFPICSVEEWEEMDDSEAKEAGLEALWNSGMVEWGY